MEPPAPWWSLTAEEALSSWGTDAEKGLQAAVVAERVAEFGSNDLPPPPRRGLLRRAVAQVTNPLIIVLIVAAVVTLVLQKYIDAAVITGVVIINAIIGLVQEGKAESALAAVSRMLATEATVIREGRRRRVDARTLVPGDLVVLDPGDRVPADARLVRVHNTQIEESALTGESVASMKSVDPVPTEASLGDRTCMAHSGTVVAAGQARAVVVATGRETEVGRIGTMVGQEASLATPLTRRLQRFALQVTAVIVGAGLLLFVYAVLVTGVPPAEAFLAVVGMAVAAIPEGLPAIITIVLAIGTRAMATQDAIVRRLPAVETLGSVSVICTDKTGTLTRNEMTAVRLLLPSGEIEVTGAGYAPEGELLDGGRPVHAEDEVIRQFAQAAVRCNDAHVHPGEDGAWQVSGDPTEGALVTLGMKAGLDPEAVRAEHPRVDAIPFESENRYMATLHDIGSGRVTVVVKGAPERVLGMCGLGEDAGWHERVAEAGRAGERVLALATAEIAAEDAGAHLAWPDEGHPEGLRLLGLIGLLDPPRPEAITAIAECQGAGITVKMVTGDHAVTAAAIGHQLGLAADRALDGSVIDAMTDAELDRAIADHDVIARASPEHKMRLIHVLQGAGAYVAMTGDGVNDAPALKAADIGVAMGGRGTDAARDAADIVLTDDDFATIAAAVRQGRIVYDNIKKALLFLLPTNAGQAGIIAVAILLGLTLPVTVGQILWVNMVVAVTLATALAFEGAEPGLMDRPPRPAREPLVTRPLAARIVFVAVLLVVSTLSVFAWETANGASIEVARTAAVNTLVFAQAAYLFNVRNFTASSINIATFTGSRVAIGVTALLIGLQLAFTYAPPLQAAFGTAPLDVGSWLVIGMVAPVVFFAVEAEKALLRHRGHRHL